MNAMEAATDPMQCLDLANEADKLENNELTKACLQRAVALDQRCQPALLNLAAMSFHQGQSAETFIWLAEASRIAPLPPEVAPMLDQLYPAIQEDARFSSYLKAVGLGPTTTAESLRNIVLLDTQYNSLSNLGGDAWVWADWVRVLRQRGHAVQVITLQPADGAGSVAAEGESEVHRNLVAGLGQETTQANVRTVIELCKEVGADVVLAGDLSGVDASILNAVTAEGIVVLQAASAGSGVAGPGGAQAAPGYSLLAAGTWAAEVVKKAAGNSAVPVRLLAPGFRLDRHYRLLLPDTATLRLALVLTLSEPESVRTALEALAALRRQHIEFQAEILTLDPAPAAEVEALKARLAGLALGPQVSVAGEWDTVREEGLLARSNVLVVAANRAERFPWLQVRAMAGGIVVVAEDLGGTAEVINPDVNGYLFPAADAGALTAHLVRLAKEPQNWLRLQRAAQERVNGMAIEEGVVRLEAMITELMVKTVRPSALLPGNTAGLRGFLANYQQKIGGVTELADVSMLTLAGLCALQNESGDRGDIMETGVFRAGTASLLASFLKPSERIFLVDPYQNVEINRRTILGFAGVAEAQLHFHTMDSVRANKRREQVFGAADPELRLIHIDGEHSYDAVFSDLDMATHFLAPGGLIVLDDIFALNSACCTHAMFDYLRQNPTVHCVAMGYRKAYLCESRHLLKYRRFFLRLPELVSAVLGSDVRVCFNDFSLERGYLTFSDCGKGEPRYQVVGKRFHQLRDASAAMGIAW
ncbi:MAG: glycosyltransferase [Verrucomicrobia bacterium]|nr:glycosyltransferase [Verrucomicrobiota bacterium]